jgi:AraC family transcriptional regulator of adaptative response / DNA-3-methyladenine glycosylase II
MKHAISATKKHKINSWHELEIDLPYIPPLDWRSLLDYFSSHEIGGTEKAAINSYERVFEIDGIRGFLLIAHHADKPALVLKLWIQDKRVVPVVVERVRKMFDLDLDHAMMLSHLNAHSIFQGIIKNYPALRAAKGWDAFEIIVLTVLGQVVSVKRAKHLMKELVENHGTPVQHPLTEELFFLFPTPKQLATADLAHLGTTQARKDSLKIISSLLLDKKIDLYKDDIEALKNKLLAVPGIGKWSVEYIALRGFGHADAFPKTDLALRRVIKYYPEFNIDLLRPWRSYAAVYLWKDYIMQPEKYKGIKQ